MLAFISRLVMQFAAIRWLFKLGGLALLLPLAAALKVIGLPLLMILMVLGAPILLLLFLFGLPIFLVLLVGGLLIGLLGMLLTLGVAALKFAIFVVLPVWLAFTVISWLFDAIFRRGRDDRDGGVSDGDVPPAAPAEPVDPIDLGTPPDMGADPAV